MLGLQRVAELKWSYSSPVDLLILPSYIYKLCSVNVSRLPRGILNYRIRNNGLILNSNLTCYPTSDERDCDN